MDGDDNRGHRHGEASPPPQTWLGQATPASHTARGHTLIRNVCDGFWLTFARCRSLFDLPIAATEGARCFDLLPEMRSVCQDRIGSE